MNLVTAARALGDRVLAWSCIGLGLLALLLGYLGVKDTAFVAEQLPYVVSGGLLGLFLLGTGAVLLLSADLRDQWRALLDIRDELAARPEPRAGSVRELLDEVPPTVVPEQAVDRTVAPLPLEAAARADLAGTPAPRRRRPTRTTA